MYRHVSPQVTEWLLRWRSGDREALDSLIPLVYRELRRMAHRYLRDERDGHTLQSTALVHELYVRLLGQNPPDWQNRCHFFAVSAQLMRQILVDYSRTHRARKRGGSVCRVTFDHALNVPHRKDVDIAALDVALHGLAAMDPQQCRIVELRFFGGLSIEEVSEVLGISVSTVKRNWTSARAWLYRALDETAAA